MDGNGRWARRQGLPRLAGHTAGAATVDLVTEECARLGLEALTLYSFSSENWKRPADEIDGLMALCEQHLLVQRERMLANNIRFRRIGRRDGLPASVLENLELGAVPLQQTLFSGLNLFVSLGVLVLVTITLYLLAPRKADQIRTAGDLGITESGEMPVDPEARSGILAIAFNLIIGAALVTGMILYLADEKRGFGSISPNEINATMLGLGMILHVSPASYLRSIESAVRGCAGIIVQFPLYAGIMMMMSVSGLMMMASDFAVASSTPKTLPLLTFFSAGVVNFFVPSGGGQWGVQGPIALEAGAAAGVSPSKMIMSVAYGDQLTNMLQPFWALPLLAITGIKAREIVGYTAFVMVIAGVWMALGLLIF